MTETLASNSPAPCRDGSTNRLAWSHLPKQSGIYEIRNLATGEAYIGATANIRNRVRRHSAGIEFGGCSRRIAAAFGGEKTPDSSARVIELCEEEQLAARESHWISIRRPSCNTRTGTASMHPGPNLLEKRVAISGRKKLMAMAVRGGRSKRDVAQDFGVSLAVVVRACKESPADLIAAV